MCLVDEDADEDAVYARVVNLSNLSLDDDNSTTTTTTITVYSQYINFLYYYRGIPSRAFMIFVDQARLRRDRAFECFVLYVRFCCLCLSVDDVESKKRRAFCDFLSLFIDLPQARQIHCIA